MQASVPLLARAFASSAWQKLMRLQRVDQTWSDKT
jgi:hypothetical protein